jgi:hypothetical protein
VKNQLKIQNSCLKNWNKFGKLLLGVNLSRWLVISTGDSRQREPVQTGQSSEMPGTRGLLSARSDKQEPNF